MLPPRAPPLTEHLMSKLPIRRWSDRPLFSPRPSAPLPLAQLELARAALGPHGFLPVRAPASPVLCTLADVCRELPLRYHLPEGDVRPWLREVFESCPEHQDTELDPAGLDDLMVVVTHLAHAFRWAAMPAPAASHALAQVDLPRGLARLWSRLAAQLDVPRCGNLYHMVLHGWSADNIRPGAEYTTDRLLHGGLAPLYPWLRGREADELSVFTGAVVETEAHGAAAVDLAVPLFAAVARDDTSAAAELLDRLAAVVAEIGKVFARAIRKQQVSPHTFLALIQPHFLWGLEHEGEVLEGASGAQTPCFQLLDAMLAVPRESPAAQAATRSRAGLPPRHRGFLAAVDALGGELRAFVGRTGDHALADRYNECVRGLQHWRRMHQKRGALYLAGDPQRPVPEYMSVGRLVGGAGDPAGRFDAAMEAHVQETAQVLFPSEHFEAPPRELLAISASMEVGLVALRSGGDPVLERGPA